VRTLRRFLLAFTLTVAPVALSVGVHDAVAATAYESPYTYEQTFGTAVRLLRLDLGVKITEKDLDGGFVTFDYTSPESGKRVTHGSIELVRSRGGTHVTVQLPALPSYHEQMVVDALSKKLFSDHGEPPPKPSAPKAPEGDGGAGDGGAPSESPG
jgi:hypothetical protein